MFCLFGCHKLKKVSSHQAVNSLSHEMDIMAAKHAAIGKLEMLGSNYSYVLDVGSGISYSIFIKNETDGNSIKISDESPRKFWKTLSSSLDAFVDKKHSLNM